MTTSDFESIFKDMENIFSQEIEESRKKRLLAYFLDFHHLKLNFFGGPDFYDIIKYIDTTSEKAKQDSDSSK